MGFDRTSYEAEGQALLKGLGLTNNFLRDMNFIGKRIGAFTDCQSWISKIDSLTPADDFEA